MIPVASRPLRMDRQMNQLIYDDECGFCRAQVRQLRALDWFRTIEFHAASDPKALTLAPGLTREGLMAAMHAISPAGSVFRGARAFRQIGLSIPCFAPLALLMWVPGVVWFADRVYERIARNRYFLSRFVGCDEVCALPATSKPLPDTNSKS